MVPLSGGQGRAQVAEQEVHELRFEVLLRVANLDGDAVTKHHAALREVADRQQGELASSQRIRVGDLLGTLGSNPAKRLKSELMLLRKP